MEQFLGVWDYTNQQEWIRRVARADFPPLIISVAITGGFTGKELNPNHPVTPEEQAAQTYDCYNAGASMVHIHGRDPNNLSMPSNDVAVYRKIDALIREKCPDIIINNTTSGAGATIEDRLASIYAPAEVASLDMGPLVIRMALKDFEIDMVHPTTATFSETENFAKAMSEKGVKPEMEVWHTGQLWLVHNLIDKGLVPPPYLIQFVMGFQSGAYATPKELLHMLDSAPMPSVFFVLGVGSLQVPMITMGILLGLHVRTGMEDNVYYRRHELCKDNAQLVEKVVRIARELGREIATPKQARQMLGLSEKASQY